MASGPRKPTESAEKAYAAAAAKADPVKARQAKKPQPVLDKTVRTSSAAPAASEVEPAGPIEEVRAPALAPTDLEPPAVAVSEPVVATEVLPPVSTITELKEKIMATAAPDFTTPVTDAFGEFQSKAKAAYEKSTAALTEATEFAKGNVEALVESSKILAAGAQDLGKGYVEEAKSAYETLTADLKEFAAIKSPTELFQLQGKIARRNFDALVAASSKNTEAMLKLANDSFAPLSGRVNLAAEKISKAA